MASPSGAFDEGGKLLDSYDYEPFGAELSGSAAKHRVGFGTAYAHPGLALLLFRHRAYDPLAGLWVSHDPLNIRPPELRLGAVGQAASRTAASVVGAGPGNDYVYCRHDPINRRDPFGLEETYFGFGFTLDLDVILPVLSGGGGSWGINIQYLTGGPNAGLTIYGYSPTTAASEGFSLGASCQVNVSWGNDGWTGPFDNYGGQLGLWGLGYFQSPDVGARGLGGKGSAVVLEPPASPYTARRRTTRSSGIPEGAARRGDLRGR